MNLEIILDVELFAEEHNAFALRNAEVMNCEDHCCCVLLLAKCRKERLMSESNV